MGTRYRNTKFATIALICGTLAALSTVAGATLGEMMGPLQPFVGVCLIISPFIALGTGHLARYLSKKDPATYAGRKRALVGLFFTYGVGAFFVALIASGPIGTVLAKHHGEKVEKQSQFADADRETARSLAKEVKAFYLQEGRFPDSFDSLHGAGFATEISETRAGGKPWEFTIKREGDYKRWTTSFTQGEATYWESVEEKDLKAGIVSRSLSTLKKAASTFQKDQGTLPNDPRDLVQVGLIQAKDLRSIEKVWFDHVPGWLRCRFPTKSPWEKEVRWQIQTPTFAQKYSATKTQAEDIMREIEKVQKQILRFPRSIAEFKDGGGTPPDANAFGQTWEIVVEKGTHINTNLSLRSHIELEPSNGRAPHSFLSKEIGYDERSYRNDQIDKLFDACKAYDKKHDTFPKDGQALVKAELTTQAELDRLKPEWFWQKVLVGNRSLTSSDIR